MIDQKTYVRRIALSALATPLCLIGGMLLSFALGSLIFDSLPGHMREASRILLSALISLGGLALAGAVWGLVMARILGRPGGKRVALAAAAGVSVSVVLMGLLLARLELILVEQGRGPDLPIHRTFTLLFVPSAAVVAGAGAAALGWGLGRGRAAALRLGLRTGLAGGLGFLAVNLVMEAAGWVVGAPGAALRATMLTVMFAGSLAAAIAGGAVIGALAGRQPAPAGQPEGLVPG